MHNSHTVSNPRLALCYLFSSQVIASPKKVYTEDLKKAEENFKAAIQSNEELRVRLTNIDLKAIIIHFVYFLLGDS